jgi:hypothetical protein
VDSRAADTIKFCFRKVMRTFELLAIAWRLLFRLTGERKRNQNQCTEAVLLTGGLMNDLSSYVFSPLREGDIALYRGSGNGLPPILLVATGEPRSARSSGCNTNMRSGANLTRTGRRDQSR